MSLRNCRQFYLVYPNINLALSEYALPGSIWQTASAKFKEELIHTDYKGVESKAVIDHEVNDPWFGSVQRLVRLIISLRYTFL